MRKIKKVTFNRREFIDKYTCIDSPITRPFIDYWYSFDESLVYFKQGEYKVFVVDVEDIINIEE